ncbi:copper radical oxidase [Glonium stellatum]|uniref:Copper radical oxidase n=1 Tax=Glonium stellatum TaxID=574774 RepID=A0A8E2ENV7_9PEZI|nr:copper radical oxidase [Glonium stellatum]
MLVEWNTVTSAVCSYNTHRINVIDIGATLQPESDCNMPCSGNSSEICGAGDRLTYYTWGGSPLYVWEFPTGNDAGLYEFLIGGVVVPLLTTASTNGKVTFLEKYGIGPPNSTGAYKLDLTQINNFTAAWRTMHVKTDIFCSGSVILPDRVGRQINVGGWANDATCGVRLYWPDGSLGQPSTNDWEENVNELSLQAGRWYPSVMVMANGSLLVVDGEEGSNGAPVPSLKILPKVGPTIFCDYLDRTNPYNLYPFLAVLPSGGVLITYYNEARILDEVTLETTRTLSNIPGAGTAMLLPQYAPYTDPLTIIICGRSVPGPEVALDNCTIERMPSKRVETCMVALPDGTYLILNGGQQGRAGFGTSSDPNLNALLYDPSKPVNQRISVMANTIIARSAILLMDGRVLVSGSDPEDSCYPQDINNTDWAYGQTVPFTITSNSSGAIRVSLIGAVSSTHGNSMGQHTIFPAFSCSGNFCTVTAPPNAYVSPPGWFMVFVLDGPTPSFATWVRIGGDPANLGSWPDYPDFTVPGSGPVEVWKSPCDGLTC